MVSITPEASVVWLKYKLLEPVSHHDPGQADKSNFSMYRRQLRRFDTEEVGRFLSQKYIDSIVESHKVPSDVVEFFDDEPFFRFVATCIAKEFIVEYNRYEEGNGIGLFSGVKRYQRLEDRMSQTSIRVRNLKEFWCALTKEMKVPSFSRPDVLMRLITISSEGASGVLHQFSNNHQIIRMLAQLWKNSEDENLVKLDFDIDSDDMSVGINQQSVAIPVHSGNDIRHDFRESLMYHLLSHLEIGFDEMLPLHVRVLLENGGSISESSPDGVFKIQQEIRARHPMLGLLGGCMPGFVLGDGSLQSVSAFYKGKENNEALSEIGVKSEDSVVELLDLWTLTRHSLRTEESSMPFEFEVIQPGAELYVRCQFHPFVSDLEIGAFAAAIDTFKDTESTIGGASARGFGRVKVEIVKSPEDIDSKKYFYEKYLQENKSQLIESLKDGTLRW